MTNNADYALFSVSGNPALPPRPLASWAEDPRNAPTITAIAVFVGAIVAVGGLLAGKFLIGGGGGPPGGTTVGPVASASSSARAAGSAAPAEAAGSAAPAAAGGCPAGMVFIAGGKATMGSDSPEFKPPQRPAPAHEVTIDAFCIDAYEVTAGDYKACADTDKCKTPPSVPDYPKSGSTSDEEHDKKRKVLAELCTFGKAGMEKHPINCVSWELADTYCKVQGKRLPTEAEWEFAARGTSGRRFPWGTDLADHTFMNACGAECNAWETAHDLPPSPRMYEGDDTFPGTAPVGSFPNGKTFSGIYDLVGNVFEWTSDWYEDYKPGPATNPKGPDSGERKAMRGGAFNSGSPLWINAAFRFSQVATASAPGIGFRCAVSK